MNQHVHPIFQSILDGLFCTEKEETEGSAEITTLGPCNATGEEPESSEAAHGKETVV